MKRMDYAANRGPLDGREYVRRPPDPFSVVAGCIGIIITVAAIIGAVALIGQALLGA